MNRAPGFMMYPAKFIAGTRHLSVDAREAFTQIMLWMWEHSQNYYSMPDTDAAWSLASNIRDPERLKMVRDEIMNPLFPLLKKVKQKLVCNGLKKERAGQVSRRKKASNAGLKSGNARRRKALSAELKPNSGATKGELQPNTSIVVPITNSTSTKKKEHLSNQTAVRLVDFLIRSIRETQPDFKEPNKKEWYKHADYMLRLDKRDPAEVKTIVQWIHGSVEDSIEPHDFWGANIMSTLKLREQFDQLKRKKANEEQPKPNERPEQSWHCLVCGHLIGDYSHIGAVHTTPCYSSGDPHKFTTDGKPIADD